MPCRRITKQELENLPPNTSGHPTKAECENSTGCGCQEGEMRWWETISEALEWSSIDDCIAMEGVLIPRSGGLIIGQFQQCDQCVVAQIYGAECYFGVTNTWGCPPGVTPGENGIPEDYKCSPQDWGGNAPTPTYTRKDPPEYRWTCDLKPKAPGTSGVIVEGGLFEDGFDSFGVEFFPGEVCGSNCGMVDGACGQVNFQCSDQGYNWFGNYFWIGAGRQGCAVQFSGECSEGDEIVSTNCPDLSGIVDGPVICSTLGDICTQYVKCR